MRRARIGGHESAAGEYRAGQHGTAAEFAVLDDDGSGFASPQELEIVASRAAARKNFKNSLVTATDNAADAVREENFRAMLVSF